MQKQLQTYPGARQSLQILQYSVGSGYLTSRLRRNKYSARASTGSSGCLVQIACSPSAKNITRLSCKYWRIAYEFLSMMSFCASRNTSILNLVVASFYFLMIFSKFSSLKSTHISSVLRLFKSKLSLTASFELAWGLSSLTELLRTRFCELPPLVHPMSCSCMASHSATNIV